MSMLFKIQSLDSVLVGETSEYEVAVRYMKQKDFVVTHIKTHIVFCGSASMCITKLKEIIEAVERIQEADETKLL